MADDQIVNAEQTSVGETVSTEAEVTEQPQEQPFTDAQKDAIQQLIAEQSGIARETGRREMQGVKDREVADAQRRAKFAEDSLTRVRGKFGELDPEARQVLENEDLRARVQVHEQRQQQEVIERLRTENAQALNQALLDHLSGLDIDHKDERIDWGHGATNLPEGLRRFNKSIAKIVKEDVSATEQKAKQDAKDKLAQERKEAGLDSTETGIPVGVSKGIPTNLTALRKWVKNLSTEEYAAKQKDIEEMLAKGQIR